MTNTRTEALEAWADRIESAGLKEADTETPRAIAELAETRDGVDERLTDAVRSARDAHRSWSEIGTMSSVSKQATQRKYGPKISAQPEARGVAVLLVCQWHLAPWSGIER